MPFDISDSPQLTREAKLKGGKRLASEQRVAERALGLAGLAEAIEAKDPDDLLAAQDYIAMQVSLQMARNPKSYLASAITTGSRSTTYRDGVMLHPMAEDGAAAIIAKLEPEVDATGGGFRIFPGFR